MSQKTITINGIEVAPFAIPTKEEFVKVGLSYGESSHTAHLYKRRWSAHVDSSQSDCFETHLEMEWERVCNCDPDDGCDPEFWESLCEAFIFDFNEGTFEANYGDWV